jgi:hypothetical protein
LTTQSAYACTAAAIEAEFDLPPLVGAAAEIAEAHRFP